jgi:hypothetical protein
VPAKLPANVKEALTRLAAYELVRADLEGKDLLTDVIGQAIDQAGTDLHREVGTALQVAPGSPPRIVLFGDKYFVYSVGPDGQPDMTEDTPVDAGDVTIQDPATTGTTGTTGTGPAPAAGAGAPSTLKP